MEFYGAVFYQFVSLVESHVLTLSLKENDELPIFYWFSSRFAAILKLYVL
jgi:hypothetical protein